MPTTAPHPDLNTPVLIFRSKSGRTEVARRGDALSIHVLASSDKLDMDEARQLAHAILDADRRSFDAKPLARIEIIDVAAQAREVCGEAAETMRPGGMPEHDYRFEGTDPVTGSHWTAGYQYTAADVMAAILEDRRLRKAGL